MGDIYCEGLVVDKVHMPFLRWECRFSWLPLQWAWKIALYVRQSCGEFFMVRSWLGVEAFVRLWFIWILRLLRLLANRYYCLHPCQTLVKTTLFINLRGLMICIMFYVSLLLGCIALAMFGWIAMFVLNKLFGHNKCIWRGYCYRGG